MGLRSRLASWLGGRAEQPRNMTADQWFAEYGDWMRSDTGLVINQRTAMQVSAVMACVAIRSEDLAKLPLHLYRPIDGGGKKLAADHPIERLLRKPNFWQTRFEFVEQMQAMYLLRGRAPAIIIRDVLGRPRALWPVNPDHVVLMESPGGQLFYQVARNGLFENALLAGFPPLIPAADVLDLRWLSLNGLTPLSRIHLGRDTIGLALAQERHAAKLFGNGARPGGVLQTDQKLDDDTITRLRAKWNDTYGTLENAGKTAVLEQGLKWAALGMSMVDAEAMDARRFSVEEIGRHFRVPMYKLGVIERGAPTNINQLDQEYANNVVGTDAIRWEHKLGDRFGFASDYESAIGEQGDAGVFAFFDLDAGLRADILTRYQAYRGAIAGGFKTPNEVRRREGDPDHAKGDTLLQATNQAPLGWTPSGDGSGPGSDATGDPAPGGDGDPTAPRS